MHGYKQNALTYQRNSLMDEMDRFVFQIFDEREQKEHPQNCRTVG